MVVVEAASCTLCGLAAVHPLYDEAGSAFCCPACREVHTLLHSEPAEAHIAAAGDHAGEVRETSLTLGGLWCSSCSWLIEETLRRTPGVQSAEVSFLQREARVAFDAEKATPKHLVRRVRGLGYKAWAEGEATALDRDEEDRHSQRLLLASIFVMHDIVMNTILYLWQLNGTPPEMAHMADFFQLSLLIMSVPLLLLLGIPILRAGIASLLRGRPNMHALIAIGAFSAFGLSLRNFILGSDALYFDTASMLLFLVSLGRWFEIRAQKNGSEVIERLWDQIPNEAIWVTPDGDQVVAVADLPAGARIRIHPGERFPVDGQVAVGEGDVDESLLTGESLPQPRRAGDTVLAGTISVDGAFEIITTATGAKTTAGQIGKMLHQALWDRAPVQQLADRLAALMVPIAVGLAAATFAFWTWRSGPEVGLLHGLSVLLIACPCALGIATPLTLWIGVSRAAESGVIVRSGSALEQLAEVRSIFFDKTGTLTQREFHLNAVSANGSGRDEMLKRAASVEVLSEHPLGQAVVSAAGAAGLALEPVTDFHAVPGSGVSAAFHGETVWIGNRDFMQHNHLQITERFAKEVAAWQQQGLCVIYAGWDGAVQGLLGLGENPRPEVGGVVRELESQKIATSVLTGDDEAAGVRWANHLSIPVFAGLRPEDKIKHLQSASGPVAMVGDGINDGPALVAASVGLAIRSGTDVAQSAADVILLNNDLRAIPWLIDLGRQAMRRVHQNLAWAFVYNLIGLGLAMAGLLQPILAALAMVISSAFVTGNALRLKRFPPLLIEDHANR